MKKRELGKNGPLISAVGYGGMSFSNFYGPADEKGSFAILDKCREIGLTHLDTADVYGMGTSEDRIGAYFSQHGASVAQSFTIATKASITRDADNRRVYRNDKAYLEAQLDKSLKRMGVEAVDLFYIHRRDPEVPIEDVTQTLVSFIEKGKITGFGFSEIAPSTLRRAHEIHHVRAVQNEYSLSTRFPELGLIQTCQELGTAFVAFSPVGRSLLTDTPHHGDSLAAIPFLQSNPRFQEPHLSYNLKITEPYRALAADLGLSAAGLAIAWLLDQGDHIIPIPGTRFVERLTEYADGEAFEMTDEVRREIDRILPVGWAHGDRYNDEQWIGPERYC